MPHHPPTASRDAQTLRLLVGGGLLLLYLAAATPLAPVLTALLAATDRSHHVALRQTARGVQVVLRHECLNSPTHRHGMVARVLTVFAQRTTPAQPDHIIQFGTTETVCEISKLVVEAEPCLADLNAPHAVAILGCISPLRLLSAAFPRPPPATSGLLLTLRSVVLLL